MRRRRRQERGRAGAVRLIGGQWRSRRIAVPSDLGVRPTPDRVRETLFNWLAAYVAGAVCLDLFAGTGVLGFEALSRGAARVQFVERDVRLAAALREQIVTLDANASVAATSAEAWLARDAAPGFDIAFVDPPYAERVEPVLAALVPWLTPAARVYVERSADEGLPELAGFEWLRRSRAGDVAYGLAAPAAP